VVRSAAEKGPTPTTPEAAAASLFSRRQRGAAARLRRAGFALGTVILAAATGEPALAFHHLRQSASVPLRDGHVLAADVFLPAASGRWPVILIQTPYNKQAFLPVFLPDNDDDPLFKNQEFAFVVTDWRGFYASADAAVAGYNRGLDGYDTVEWIAGQSWCDGNVGTWGPSALAVIQFSTAAQRPPHLRASVPIVGHPRDLFELYYPGGVYARNKNTFVAGHFGTGSTVTDHPVKDALWLAVEASGVQASDIDVPMLHISGWYDHETAISMQTASDIQAGGGPNARGRQKVLVGPWSHGTAGKGALGQSSVPAAAGESSRQAVAFFDFTLRGVANGWQQRPMLRTFRINEAFRDANTWPPTVAQSRRMFLRRDGSLDPTPGATDSEDLVFTSDPSNPVPTLFGAILIETSATQGPGDLAPIERRPDVLVFTTEPVMAPLHIEGTPTVQVWMASSAVDADIALRLTEVLPDGSSMLLVDGIRRASLRDSLETRVLLQPGAVCLVPVELPPVAVTIAPGHRLRVDLAASNYDRFDVNMQDGSSLSDGAGARAVVAEVRILLGGEHASVLELPVVIEGRVRRHLSRPR